MKPMSYDNIVTNLLNGAVDSAVQAHQDRQQKHRLADKEKAIAVGPAVIHGLCLLRGNQVIAVPHITRLEHTYSGHEAHTEFSLAAKLVFVAGIALLVLLATANAAGIGAICFLGALVLALALPKAVARAAFEMHRLNIHTDDGGAFSLLSSDKATITNLRDILVEKINGRDAATNYTVNLTTGDIRTGMDIGQIGSVGAIVTGQGNQVAATTDQGQITATQTINAVDYSAILPRIEGWAARLAEDGHADIAARVDELERLMKSGTATEKDRYRLRDLLSDLGATFHTSAGAIALFDQIRKLAGL